jgi:hypothetical protein
MRAPNTGALPKLNLITDDVGNIYVEPPKFTEDANGVIGVGRKVTQDEFDKGAMQENILRQKLQEKINNFYFPKTLPTGYILKTLDPIGSGTRALYLMDDKYEKMITISAAFCDCSKTYKQVLESEGTSPYAEFWRVNDTDIYADPTIIDATKNTRSAYSFTFYKDGFKVVFSTPLSFEDGMKLVLENYFPEYKYDDIILMPKTDLTIRVWGKMAQEICAVIEGDCPEIYLGNFNQNVSVTVKHTIYGRGWNAHLQFLIQNETLSYVKTIKQNEN